MVHCTGVSTQWCMLMRLITSSVIWIYLGQDAAWRPVQGWILWVMLWASDRSDLSFVVNSYAINPLSPEYLISRVQDLSLTGRDFLLDATQPLSYEEIRAQHGVHAILAYPHPSLLDIILIWVSGTLVMSLAVLCLCLTYQSIFLPPGHCGSVIVLVINVLGVSHCARR